jgi:ADP-heptose:LPS heptosyltransferase
VVNQLAEHFPEAKFVITGMKSEAILGETLSKNCSFDQGRIKNLAGKTNLLELSALLRKLTLYITNDTGAMHVAAAVDVPFVAIFGPGDFQRFRPFSPSGKIAFARNCQMLDCVPCIKTSCSHWQCMVNVSEDMVFDAALTLL